MRLWLCLGHLALIAAVLCPLGASAQEGADGKTAPWLAGFSQTGAPGVRRMLHGRPRYREVCAYAGKQPEGTTIRELVAVEPDAANGGGLVLVTYEGAYLCGSHGCLLEALRRDASGRWRAVLNVVAQPGFVGLGPDTSHGFKDIVLLGDHTVDFRCPVWRFNGARYEYDHLLDAGQEPCRALNEKNDRAAQALPAAKP
jgi:hypothetical protein